MPKERGYDLEDLWVDKTKNTLSLGTELILGATVENAELKLSFGALWENHLRGAEFDKLTKQATEKLQRPSKGAGKGKRGNAGKLPVDPA